MNVCGVSPNRSSETEERSHLRDTAWHQPLSNDAITTHQIKMVNYLTFSGAMKFHVCVKNTGDQQGQTCLGLAFVFYVLTPIYAYSNFCNSLIYKSVFLCCYMRAHFIIPGTLQRCCDKIYCTFNFVFVVSYK